MKTYITLLFCLFTCSFFGWAQDSNVSFPSGSLNLNGTLSIPAGAGPFPTVIFVHGSGPNDRDQTLALTGANVACLYPGLLNDTVRFFKDLAEDFTSRGVAVLRYDKRSFSHGPLLNPQTISPLDFADDIHAAVEFAKTQTEVDAGCIMLLGHSQGSNLISMVANDRTDITALLALGTPASGIDTMFSAQLRHIYYQCANDTVTGDSVFAEYTSNFAQMQNGTWPANTPFLGAFTTFWNDWINLSDSAVYHYEIGSVPTLFLQGMEDINVRPEEAQKFENELTRTGFDVYFLDGLTHNFTTANSPIVVDVVADTIFDWLRNNQPCVVASTPVQEANATTYQLFYNQDGVELSWDATQNLTQLMLLDLQGRIVQHIGSVGGTSVKIRSGNLSKGIYLLSGSFESQSFTEKILF